MTTKHLPTPEDLGMESLHLLDPESLRDLMDDLFLSDLSREEVVQYLLDGGLTPEDLRQRYPTDKGEKSLLIIILCQASLVVDMNRLTEMLNEYYSAYEDMLLSYGLIEDEPVRTPMGNEKVFPNFIGEDYETEFREEIPYLIPKFGDAEVIEPDISIVACPPKRWVQPELTLEAGPERSCYSFDRLGESRPVHIPDIGICTPTRTAKAVPNVYTGRPRSGGIRPTWVDVVSASRSYSTITLYSAVVLKEHLMVHGGELIPSLGDAGG